MDIRLNIEQFKISFEPLFQTAITEIIYEQLSFHPLHVSLDTHLHTYLADYTAGGKRIRPFLISYFADKDMSDTDVSTICIAVELFHLAALIHDDIMDQSVTRRHAPTIHTAVGTHEHHNTHLGTDVALLLGDIFLTASMFHAAKTATPIFTLFTQMVQRTIRGQYLDSFGMNQYYGSLSESEVLARHELKTGYYTFVTPGLIGNSLSDTPFNTDTLETVLRELGILFQIRDDIMDCIDTKSGKDLYGDIFENQTTWVTLYIKDTYPEKFTQLLQAKENTDTDRLKEIFNEIDLTQAYNLEYTGGQE
jgi:geranylgeranyl diphosphate synthase type I